MRIGIITAWYNEEILAPYFLKHYDYVDEIHIFLDSDTNDSTQGICKEYPNVKITPFKFEAGFDDVIKQENINAVVKTKTDFDWIFSLDVDEFIFPKAGSPKEVLERQTGDVMFARMWQVYRHKSDIDLDPDLPISQRCHGDSNLNGFNSRWIKPIIVRPRVEVVWNKGCHSIKCHSILNKMEICEESFLGAHWANADPELAVSRRLVSCQRQSENNLTHRYQLHNHNLTEEAIREQCKAHEDDPQLF